MGLLKRTDVHPVVLRPADPDRGLDAVTAFFYTDKVIITSGGLGMIILTLEETAKFVAEAAKYQTLDILGKI
ncbi:MAG: hypothetical protein AB7L09_02345 [Nitrospira sp.]